MVDHVVLDHPGPGAQRRGPGPARPPGSQDLLASLTADFGS
jgi:hypothetical protein